VRRLRIILHLRLPQIRHHLHSSALNLHLRLLQIRHRRRSAPILRPPHPAHELALPTGDRLYACIQLRSAVQVLDHRE